MPRTKLGEYLFDFGEFLEGYGFYVLIGVLILLAVCGIKL